MRILVVEDDKKIAHLLELELAHEGYEVKVVHDGYDALIEVENFNPHVVLLDILLPSLSGKEIAKRIRERYPDLGIIMLTALGDVKDKVEAFNLGADDYVVKPFSIEELLARIQAVLRRKERREEVISKYGIDLWVDQHRVFVDNKEVELSKTEFALLYLLMRNAEIVLSKEKILTSLWGDYDEERENLVEVYINYLRKKLGEKGKYIKTIRGIGYSFRED